MTTFIPSLTLPAAIFAQPAVSILLPVVMSGMVGYATRPSETQKTYMALKQPPLRPPPWVFGPVWTVLYAMMGYAAYRAYDTGMDSNIPAVVRAAKHGATLYTIQLGLNMAWMPLFFTLKRPIEATTDMFALLGTVGYLTYVWSGVDTVAAWCLAPYLGWLTFATYLCVGTSHLNGWNFTDKESTTSPKGKDTLYVNEQSSVDKVL